jgi:hypothetical protein
VIRGVNRVQTSVPLWILQRADQRVDEWPGIGDNPIFTQHFDKQWNWMWERLHEIYRKGVPNQQLSDQFLRAHSVLELNPAFRLTPYWNHFPLSGSFLDWKMLFFVTP